MQLTLYSKPGCHLCEEVRRVLDEMQPTYGFAVEEVDITADADLLAQYRYEIPVLLRDGHEIARGRMTERDLATLVAVR